MVLDMPD